MKRKTSLAVLISLLPLTGCRTLSPEAVSVQLKDKADPSCQFLGEVYADWAWWGVPTEILNVMKNQVAAKGGNTLVTQSSNMGFSYKCQIDADLRGS